MSRPKAEIIDLPELRDRRFVFRDRTHAGQVLAGMLEAYRNSGALVLAIPAGGVPVAADIARRLGLALDVAVVSKILLPWTSEAGFGAVAFDGSVWTDRDLALGMTEAMIEAQTTEAREKVRRRVQRFRGKRPFAQLAGRRAILVDDGLASGSTMRVAVAAVRRQEPSEIVVAVPTGHARTVSALAGEVDRLYCANIRGGLGFAVAEAYQSWYDEDEDAVTRILEGLGASGEGPQAG
jgi:predicted phosphoribosyltransferase